MAEHQGLKPSAEVTMQIGQVLPAFPKESFAALTTLRSKLSPTVFNILLETVESLDGIDKKSYGEA